MPETDNNNQESSPFKAIVSEEKLPLRIRDEVVGTMEIITLFGNIVQLFTSNFGNIVVAMLSNTEINEAKTTLKDNTSYSLNDNTSSLT